MKLAGNERDDHSTGDGDNDVVVAGDGDGLGDVNGSSGEASDDGGDHDDDDAADEVRRCSFCARFLLDCSRTSCS